MTTPQTNTTRTSLSLEDYHKIRTPFVFMDETGSINDKKNRFFGLGMIKCMQPHFLDYQIRLLRQKEGVYDEIKWNTISKIKVEFLKALIDIADSTPGIKFSCVIINKDQTNVMNMFENDPYVAYERLTEIMLKNSIRSNEILTVLADYITTPSDIHFEVDVKHHINEQNGRLAVAGIHRIDSKGTNILQLNDLYLGAVVYSFKLKNKLVSGDRNKIEIMEYILKKLDITEFAGEKFNPKFRVEIYDKDKITNLRKVQPVVGKRESKNNKKGPLSLRLTP